MMRKGRRAPAWEPEGPEPSAAGLFMCASAHVSPEPSGPCAVFVRMTHATANNIYERRPSPAPNTQTSLDGHPEPENDTAKWNGSKTCENSTLRCLDMGVVCARGGGQLNDWHTRWLTGEEAMVCSESVLRSRD